MIKQIVRDQFFYNKSLNLRLRRTDRLLRTYWIHLEQIRTDALEWLPT